MLYNCNKHLIIETNTPEFRVLVHWQGHPEHTGNCIFSWGVQRKTVRVRHLFPKKTFAHPKDTGTSSNPNNLIRSWRPAPYISWLGHCVSLFFSSCTASFSAGLIKKEIYVFSSCSWWTSIKYTKNFYQFLSHLAFKDFEAKSSTTPS